MNATSDIIIYESGKNGVEVRLEGETVWFLQAKMVDFFGKYVRAVNENISKNEAELGQIATILNFRIVRQDGKRQYLLDVVISVGYRVKSLQTILSTNQECSLVDVIARCTQLLGTPPVGRAVMLSTAIY